MNGGKWKREKWKMENGSNVECLVLNDGLY
jgi:hypothetical protein